MVHTAKKIYGTNNTLDFFLRKSRYPPDFSANVYPDKKRTKPCKMNKTKNNIAISNSNVQT